MKNNDKAEHIHTFLVVSVNVVKLKCSFEFIYIINYIKIIYNNILMNNKDIINENILLKKDFTIKDLIENLYP